MFSTGVAFKISQAILKIVQHLRKSWIFFPGEWGLADVASSPVYDWDALQTLGPPLQRHLFNSTPTPQRTSCKSGGMKHAPPSRLTVALPALLNKVNEDLSSMAAALPGPVDLRVFRFWILDWDS